MAGPECERAKAHHITQPAEDHQRRGTAG
jgi:hypothetical protein